MDISSLWRIIVVQVWRRRSVNVLSPVLPWLITGASRCACGCSCNKYFIFTTDSAENTYAKGLQYSVVNLGLGANGDVESASKNTILLQSAAEKIAAVSDGAGGLWVVAHGMNDNHFYSWHITAGARQFMDVRLQLQGNSRVIQMRSLEGQVSERIIKTGYDLRQ